MTADGDLDDHVPPERDDGASDDVPDESPSPVTGSPDEAPSPPVEPPSIPVLRNLRAFGRQFDESEDTGPVDLTQARTAPVENGRTKPGPDAAGAPSTVVPSHPVDPTFPDDPTFADPGHDDSFGAASAPTEPVHDDHYGPDPTFTDPVHDDPFGATPAPAEPGADPFDAALAPTGRAGTDPTRFDPVGGDAPTVAGPVADPIPAEAPTVADPVAPAPPRTARPTDGRTELALDHESEDTGEKERSPLRSLVEWVAVIVGALVVATIIKTFLFQAFWIPSDSMLPTLEVKDRVLVNKLSYDLHEVHRGDVIVFERPPGETEKIKDLIKRVIAVEGDTLTLKDGKVLVNGEAVDEPYVVEGSETVNICAFTGTVKVPDGHVFVMGDNRENSKDSRCFGPIDEDLIVGRAFIRVWPVGSLGTL